MRRALLSAAVLLAGLPAGAAASPLPTSGAFTASDFAWTAAGGGHRVTIAQGGTTQFGYPSGHSEHNAHFTTGLPSSCVQTAGDSSGAVPPLPHVPTGAGWTGSCTFNQPGTYAFHCDVHPFMTGTVAVQAAGTSPTDSPLAGSANQAVRFGSAQRGTRIRGTLRVSRAGQGGTVQASLKFGRKPAGHDSSRLRGATVKLLVKLNRAAARALARSGQLTVQVKLAVSTPAGRTLTVTRRVLLRS